MIIAAAVVVVLVAFAGGYGPHRDELYFVTAGEHLAWGYADQGPLTPLIARAMSELAPGSLTVLRLPSALMTGATVLLTGLIARELGAGRRAELIATACAAVGVVVLFTGHLLSTSTFDLLCWTAVTWLAVRAVRTGDERLWLVAGVVLGLGLLNKPLPAFLAFGLLAGVLIAGPRRLLRSPYVWAGAAIALVIWAPWLIWQAEHGWPQLDVSREIAGGASASSEPWWAIVPFQVLLISPLLAPVWIAGLVRLFRAEEMRDFRFLAWAWVVLAVVFMVSGGKPYYLAGLFGVLLGAGAVVAEGWVGRGLVTAIVLSAVVGAAIALPLLPEDSTDPVIAVNEDVGETIGWPEFTETVAAVYRPGAVILTRNYGEAGAIDRYGGDLGLPRAYSGHNAYGDWGPPPDGSAPVVAVGRGTTDHLRGCRVVARIDNDAGVDNEEQGAPVALCDGPLRPWSQVWDDVRRLG
jgi:4-amino-4-deoxy-L-arabinose transferase-like glycosyltransferase